MMQSDAENSESPAAQPDSDQPRAPLSLFREDALQSKRYRWLGPVSVITPPSAFVALVLVVVAGLLLLLAAVTIEIPERVHAIGMLLPADKLLKVRAQRAGWVEQLAVANGNTVVKGQALMRLTDRQHAPRRRPQLAERIASLQREIELLDDLTSREVDTARSQLKLNRRRQKLLRQRLLVAEHEHESWRHQAAIYQDRAMRVAELLESGAIAEHRVQELAAVAFQAEATSQSAWQRILAFRDDLALLEQQLLLDSVRPETLRAQANMRREVIMRDIAVSELLSEVEVTAPDGGLIAGLNVRTGDYVNAGQVLLTLHDPASRLEAYLYVGTDDAGFIEVGQHVELQLQAFPHQLYGTQTAIVTSVSGVAQPGEEIGGMLSIRGAVFEIRASLVVSSQHGGGGIRALPPGTSFRADLIRRRWPLYRWLLRSAIGADTANG
jgi:membrane fusion protein